MNGIFDTHEVCLTILEQQLIGDLASLISRLDKANSFLIKANGYGVEVPKLEDLIMGEFSAMQKRRISKVKVISKTDFEENFKVETDSKDGMTISIKGRDYFRMKNEAFAFLRRSHGCIIDAELSYDAWQDSKTVFCKHFMGVLPRTVVTEYMTLDNSGMKGVSISRGGNISKLKTIGK